MIRSFLGFKPRIDAPAFIHDSAEIIGRVRLRRGVSIWPMVVLRGDVDRIEVGEGSNLQDGVVVHCHERQPTVIGRGVTVGHGAIIHGARIGDLCLVGMGAIVMEAEIGRECLIGAGTLVPKGFKAPPGRLVIGFPARVSRRLTAAERRSLKAGRDGYGKLADAHRKSSRVVF